MTNIENGQAKLLRMRNDGWKDACEVVIMWLLFIACIMLVGVGVFYLLIKFKEEFSSLDIAIQVAFFSFWGSCVGFLLSKRYDLHCRLREQLEVKRRNTYEHIVSFLFECQQREGCSISAPTSEIELRCFKVTQAVLLWASEPVQKEWQSYLYFRKSGKGGQMIVARILYQMGREFGSKYKDSFFAGYRPLNLFYCGHTPTICFDDEYDKI